MEIIETDNEARNEATQRNATTVLMVGTNDIKQEKLATECINDYMGITEKLDLDETKYIVAQIPPKYTINKHDQERETTKFNTYLEITFPNKIAILTKIKESRHLIEKDGIHLTEEASKITADIIIETINNTNKDRVTEVKNEKVLITLDNSKKEEQNKMKQDIQHNPAIERIEVNERRAAAVVIGKGGERIMKTKTKHQVDIDTEYIGNQALFIIRGEPERVKRTKEDIEKTIKSFEDQIKTETESNKRNIPCRYHKEGNCHFGSRCHYLHHMGPVDLSPNTPPKETARPRQSQTPTKTEHRVSSEEDSPKRSWRQSSSKTREQSEKRTHSQRDSSESKRSNHSRDSSRHRPREQEKNPREYTTKRGKERTWKQYSSEEDTSDWEKHHTRNTEHESRWEKEERHREERQPYYQEKRQWEQRHYEPRYQHERHPEYEERWERPDERYVTRHQEHDYRRDESRESNRTRSTDYDYQRKEDYRTEERPIPGTSRYHRKYYEEKYKRPTERELDDAMEILKRAKYNH